MIFSSKSKQQQASLEIRKTLKTQNIFFLTALTLPIISLFGFGLGYLTTGPKLSENGSDITTGIAKVIANEATGTAFLISPDKLITCKHVIENAIESPIELRFVKKDNEILMGKVIFQSKNYDYAIIQLSTKLDDSYHAMKLGSSADVKLNQEIATIGYPEGIFASSLGTISNTDVNGNSDLLQMWLGAWHGSSGSPVFDKSNNTVLGIITSGTEDSKMIFALKSDKIIEDLGNNKISIDNL
jgi:S1-C subfamily serine protease